MNAKSIRYILGWILNIEALLMLLPVATAVFYREEEGIAYALVVAVCAAVGALLTYKKPKNPGFYAKEGFVCTALGWILMSVFGCLPFMLTDEIPSFIDALFEMVSAFGTVGLSTGVTPGLSAAGKLVSIAMMLIGRLGPMTVATLWYFSRGELARYPEGNIAIG